MCRPRQFHLVALLFAVTSSAYFVCAQTQSIAESGTSSRVSVQKPQSRIVFVRADPSMDMVSNMMGAPGYARTAVVDPRKDEIAIMNPDGTGVKDLHVNGMDPVISPDGTKIAYCSGRDTQYFQIYVVNVDGSAPKRLTNVNTGDACGPSWSHDGKMIAFYAFAQTNPSRNPQIWIMAADGSNQKHMLDRGVDPVWSPDDRKIAYAARVDTVFQIFVANSDGTNVRRLTNHRAEDSNPAWSPDGSVIAYVSETEGDRHALYVMAADGSKEHRLAASKSQDFCFPAWSPDGRTIAFTALFNLGRQDAIVREEQPRCEVRTGEYQTLAFDIGGKIRQLTDSKVRAMRPSYGRVAGAQ